MDFNQLDQAKKEYGVGSKGKDFMDLKEGQNHLKLVSDGVVLAKHFNPATKKAAICIGKDKGCPGCAAGIKVNVKFLTKVIDRNLQADSALVAEESYVKLCQLPYKVYSIIKDISESTEYGFNAKELPPFDLIVTKKKTGSNPTDVEYSVLPGRKDTPLSDEEMAKALEVSDPKEVVEKMKTKAMNEAGVTPPSEPGAESSDVPAKPF